MLGSVDRVHDHRRLTTPVVLRVGMALLCLPILVLIGAVQNAVTVNDEAVETVSEDATEGIATAQRLKGNLAGLDERAVRALLAGDERGDRLAEYAEQRRDLHDSLTAAASESPPGAAYELPLVNIDYALGHYHALVDDSFEAIDRGDKAAATELYDRAHQVMAETLLPEADFFDKANTYLLNHTYDDHREDASDGVASVVITGGLLVALLVLGQVLLARRFRRIVNPLLVAATVLALVLCVGVTTQLGRSADELAAARDEAFDSVHLLARAQATVVTVRQAQGHRLFDPANAVADAAFESETRKLFRLPAGNDVGAIAAGADSSIREDAGGYLATVLADEMAAFRSTGPAWDSLRSFGSFLEADARLRDLADRGDGSQAVSTFEQSTASTALIDALDAAQAEQQARFDEHAEAADDATAPLGIISGLGFLLLAGLVFGGLYARLREYRR